MKSKILSALAVAVTLALAGCASPSGQPGGMVTKSKVTQIQIGTSRAAVVSALGNPSSTNSQVTASGTEEILVYSKGTLVERFEGGAAAFRWGMQRELSGGPGQTYLTFRFVNGFLTSIEGL
jgi:hypothetical protein